MSFLEPLDPILPDFVPVGGSGRSYTPIVKNLPKSLAAFENKYSDPEVANSLQALIPSQRQALLRMDAERAARGANPITREQTAKIAQTLQSGQPATPARKPNPYTPGAVFSNARNDLKLLGQSIPRLPAALLGEVKALGKIGEELQSGEHKGLGGILDLPGIRLLPGAYTLSSILPGGQPAGNIIEHPLFTALDVLPFGKQLGVGKAIGRSPVGTAARTAQEAFGRTRPGQFLEEAFGTTSRDLAQMEAAASLKVAEEFNPAAKFGAGDPLTDLARDSRKLNERYSDIPLERKVELTRTMQLRKENQADIANLTDTERAFMDDVALLNGRYAEVGQREGFLKEIDGETYDAATAKTILSARKRAAEAQTFANLRASILDPTTNPLDPLSFRSAIASEGIGNRTRATVAEGYAHALDAAGYDAAPILDALKAFRRKGDPTTIENVLDVMDEVIGKGAASTRLTPEQIIEALDGPARIQPRVADLRRQVQKGDYKEAARIARGLSRRKVFTIDGMTETLEALGRLKSRQKFLSDTSKFTEANLRRKIKAAELALKKNPPARFAALIEEQVQSKLKGKVLIGGGSPDDIARTISYVADRNWRAAGIDADEVATLTRETAKTWQDMKAAGYDPVFVHRVSPAQADAMNYPRVLETVRTPSQVKKRGLDATPYVEDATVALSHQGLEWLSRRGTQEFVDNVISTFSKNIDDVRDSLRGIAESRARKTPGVSIEAHLDRLVKQNYERFDPNSIITWKPASAKGDLPLIPKSIANNLRRMQNPINNGFTSAMDPIMNVFRTSVLPFSPRWQVYNLFGGAFMLTGQTDPGVFRFLSNARELLKTGETTLGDQVIRLPDDMRRAMGSSMRDTQEFNMRGGTTMRRFMDEAQQKGIPGAERAGEVGGKVASGVSKAADFSYKMNSFVDDMYRSMAYLYGYDKSIAKGMSREAAEQAGMSVARKTLQDWTRLTPIERSAMRYVFPFYGWMQHILRYTMKYPIDHPWRMAIIGSFARTELEDMQGGLPESFLNSFFLGTPDKDGNTRTVSLTGMNPFRDVANYFSLAGFVGQSNPIVTTVLQQLGVDPVTGRPELYPDLSYDPDTGRLVQRSKNPLQTLVESTLPQSRIITGMMQSGSEYKELLRTNPEAAARLLRSQAGLPVIFRTVNIPQQIAKAELARQTDEQNAFNSALKSGVDTRAMEFPGLREQLEQIRKLQAANQLQGYTPPQQGISNLQAAQDAIVRMNAP